MLVTAYPARAEVPWSSLAWVLLTAALALAFTLYDHQRREF